MSLFLAADACLSCHLLQSSKPPPSQASYAESQAFFKHSPHTNSKSPRMTSNLEKSDGLVHCSMKNAAVLWENQEEEEEEGRRRRRFWPSGDFLVRYFCDTF